MTASVGRVSCGIELMLFSRSVMRRVITLINQLATAMGTSAALQTQAESANKAAKKYMEDNEMLKQVKNLKKLEAFSTFHTEIKRLIYRNNIFN